MPNVLPQAPARAARFAAPDVFATLRAQAAGTLLTHADAGYDEARRLWNGMIDKRPAAILRCTGSADVAAAVRFAAAAEMPVAVRSGGHSISGHSSCDGGLMIDLSMMKGITVDPEQRLAHAEPGLLLAEFDAATQMHGLATTMGINGDTGIAGLTLGGGLGRLARKHGLACDNLISAEVVLADGSVTVASERENPDLLWGLRGGGGNLGVVTRFTYRLHPVGPTVLGGMLLWSWSDAREAMRAYARFCDVAPDEVDAIGVLLTGPAGDPVFAVSSLHVGAIDDGERALAPLRQATPRPMHDAVAPVAYAALQSAADPMFPRGRRYYWKSHFLAALPDAAIDVLMARFERVPSPLSKIGLQLVGGAISRVPPDATAYAHRNAAWDCIPIASWVDAAEDAANIAWSRGVWDAMRSFATGGVYVNNLGEEGEDRVRAAYGVNHGRLAALKARYDPANLFRGNANVPPAVATAR